MIPTIVVFIGGGLGAAARHGVNLLAARWIGIDFPWGTLIVNLTGSLVMGALAAWFAFRSGPLWTQEMRLFATTGFLGGFTTFSAFSLDAALLWERNAFVPFAIYVLASVGLSILGLFVGLWIVRSAI
jgi:fluoride exporter